MTISCNCSPFCVLLAVYHEDFYNIISGSKEYISKICIEFSFSSFLLNPPFEIVFRPRPVQIRVFDTWRAAILLLLFRKQRRTAPSLHKVSWCHTRYLSIEYDIIPGVMSDIYSMISNMSRLLELHAWFLSMRATDAWNIVCAGDIFAGNWKTRLPTHRYITAPSFTDPSESGTAIQQSVEVASCNSPLLSDTCSLPVEYRIKSLIQTLIVDKAQLNCGHCGHWMYT